MTTNHSSMTGSEYAADILGALVLEIKEPAENDTGDEWNVFCIYRGRNF